VIYCKRSNKKHKTYEEGVIVVKGRSASLRNMENKEVTKRSLSTNPQSLSPG